MRTLFASVLLILPLRASAETALSQLGDAGGSIQEQAGALSRRVAERAVVDARLDRVTAMPRTPAYTQQRIEEKKAKLTAELARNPEPWRARVLRTNIAELENKVEARFEKGGSCQQSIDDAVAAHWTYLSIAIRDMNAVYSAQIAAVESVAAKLRAENGEAGSMLKALSLDRQLIGALGARLGQESDAARNLRSSLENQGLDSVLKLAAAEAKDGAALVAAAETAAGLARVEPQHAPLVWRMSQGENPYLRACTDLIRSSQEVPQNENPEAFGYRTDGRKYYVQYDSCVDVSLADGAVKAGGLHEALSAQWGTTDVVRLAEDAYVNASAGDCLDLEAARRAYNELR